MSLRVSVAKAFKHVPRVTLFNTSISQPQLTQEHCEFFHSNGYIVFENFLNDALVDPLLSRFIPVFDGKFDTGVYPDEWYGGRNMCYPHITREICNVWKSDLKMAQIALSSQIHSIATQLMNYNISNTTNTNNLELTQYNYGSRIAQDDMLWKPKECGTSLGFHQDSTYISDQFEFIPNRLNVDDIDNNDNNNNNINKNVMKSVTVWLPFDDVSVGNGTIEYVNGSHKWSGNTFNMNIDEFGFHDSGPQSKTDINKHRNQFINMVERSKCSKGLNAGDRIDSNNNEYYDFVSVEIPRGGVAIHHENMWHGSGMNIDKNNERRVLAVHTLNNMCQFNSQRIKNNQIGYIYGKYPIYDENEGRVIETLNERYFPICYGGDQSQRSKWLNDFVEDIDILA